MWVKHFLFVFIYMSLAASHLHADWGMHRYDIGHQGKASQETLTVDNIDQDYMAVFDPIDNQEVTQKSAPVLRKNVAFWGTPTGKLHAMNVITVIRAAGGSPPSIPASVPGYATPLPIPGH
jgi:hypothetical protein